MLSSGCTGWDPNIAEIAVADSIMGTWKTIRNPCTGPDADKTFYAQSTYVQPVVGKKNAYIAMFDRWKKKDLEDKFGIHFDEVFAYELGKMKPYIHHDLVELYPDRLVVLPKGKIFVRAVAMQFDRYLRESNRAGGYSRIA